MDSTKPQSSPVISRLDKNLVHKICSGQVVVTLASAVKELLENSIDANASKIEIKLRGHGSDSIEVIDNGSGIKEEDFEGLTGKYCTSKLNTFDDLSSVETYGFRGEALSSLCRLARVTIHTCAAGVKMGTKLEFDSSGQIVNRRGMARAQGTTVCVNELFYDLPVRRRHLTDPNRLSKEFSKVINLLTAYCLVCVGIQISCNRIGKKGELINVISNGPSISVKDNIAAIFGHTQLNSLMELEEIDAIPDDICEEFDINRTSDQNSIRISGYVSKPPNLISTDNISSPVMNSSLTLSSSSNGKRRASSVCGHSSSERQFVYVNGRPCDLPKLTRLATDLWRRCSREAYSSITSGISLPNRSTCASFPVLVLMLTMPTKTVDINLTPDKRTLLLHHENYVLALAKAVLVKTLFNSIGMDIDSLSQSRLNLNESQIVTMPNNHDGNDRENGVGGDSVFGGSQEVSFSTPTYPRQSTLSDNGVSSTKRAPYSEDVQSTQIEIINLTPETPIRQSRDENISLESSQPIDSQEGDVENCDEIDNMEDQIYFNNIHLESTEVNFSMDNLRNRWSELLQTLSSTHGIDQSSRNDVVGYDDEQGDNNNNTNNDCDVGNFSFGQFRATEDKEAENELTMYFKKETFNSLQVIGQFNLGFIIARHRNDLFIIDQHASDEKYRFEQLAENYRFKSQPLVVHSFLLVILSGPAI
uniref:DNA mismatch repair protein S5 domain-containing protein n=1 Tax=Trichobilharzia regenti TaxID=157069 RepID=A0AA85IXV5_TRIRE|nr:unnamed protein product [Trichobilharzia regenti]